MGKWYEQVIEFHKVFGHYIAESPRRMSSERRAERFGFMHEELMEFVSADDIVDQADAMADLIYLALGTFVEMGVEPDAIFEAVHRANMNKLWPDGKPRWRDGDGKVIKPPDWIGPEGDIRDEVVSQIGERVMEKYIGAWERLSEEDR